MMAYFTYDQEEVLRKLVDRALEKDDDLAVEVRNSDVVNAFQKDAFFERTREDVEMNIENDSHELTEQQLKEVIHLTMNYDYGDYNEFIESNIKNVLQGENN